MVKKNKHNAEQVQEKAKPPETKSSVDESNPSGEDSDMKRRRLSRDSTLGSIQEEDSSSIDEKLMIESFKSITDVFENEENGEETAEEAKNVPAKNESTNTSESKNFPKEDKTISRKAETVPKEDKTISKEAETVQKTRSRSISEGTDSMDEEVRRIMSKDEEEDAFSKKSSDADESDENTDDERSDSVMTETESESESDAQFSDSETEDGNETETSANDAYPNGNDIDEDESDLSEEEEFDLEKYIDKLCLQSTDEESDIETTIESDDDSTSSKNTKKSSKMRRASKRRSDDEDSRSESDSSDDEIQGIDDADDGTTKGSGIESSNDSDDSSYLSSAESDLDYYDDDDDSASSSSETSKNEETESEEQQNPQASQIYSEDLQTSPQEPGNQPHDAVRKYYLGFDQEKCPVRLDVHENEIGRISLDSSLSSRSVVSLRWPYSNYYVKELDLNHDESDAIFDEGLLPTYKSMQSSASFPGRRRDVLSGRIWWVEWWASSLSDVESSERSVEDLQPKDGDDDFPEIGELDDISLDESTDL